MVGLAVAQANGVVGNSGPNVVMLFVAGLAGASAMILPGLSGGYLLLLLGQYVPILSAIDEFKDALQDRDIQAAFIPGVSVMLPVAVGVVVGVAAVGNLLKWLLEKHRQPTLGFLLGLLVGSTAGLFPYQQSRPPRLGEVIKGQVVTTATIDDLDAEDWPTEFYTPGAFDLLSSAGLIFVGFGITVAIARLGGRGNSSLTSTERP